MNQGDGLTAHYARLNEKRPAKTTRPSNVTAVKPKGSASGTGAVGIVEALTTKLSMRLVPPELDGDESDTIRK